MDRTAGEILNEVVQDALDDARALKESFQHRSVIVITTSGTLVAITLGMSALATGSAGFVMPRPALLCVIVALALLLAAAFVALLNNMPRQQQAVDLDKLRARGATAADWRTDGIELEVEAYEARQRLTLDLRTGNERRKRLLLAALILECAALCALSAGTAWILLST